MIVLVMEIKAKGFSRKWRSETVGKKGQVPGSRQPDNYRAWKAVVV